jgi:hypothetical protein
MNPALYFKQLEIGPMQNYVYLIGSTETRKVAVVDAAWEIRHDSQNRGAGRDGRSLTLSSRTPTRSCRR